MTKVEQVALAIWQKKMNTKDGVEIFNRLTARDEWLGIARAAIEAMRGPTDKMKESGSFTGWSDGTGAISEVEAAEVWHDMIDAALSETSEDKS